MKHTLLQSTLRELQTLVRDYRLWLVFGANVALFAATGPFGTYASLQIHERLGYWLLVHAVAWSMVLLFIAWADVALQRRLAHPLARMLVGAALASLPMAAAITAINGALLSMPVTAGAVFTNIGTTLPVSLAVSLLSFLALNRNAPSKTPAAVESAAAPRRAALLDRLPPDKRGVLHRIEVQDHYVLVVTSRGREMLLMRLADAIREAAPVDGMQVHRSHWVAREAVREIVREPGKNGRTLIRTVDGVTVPVSRGNVAEVRAWVDAGAA